MTTYRYDAPPKTLGERFRHLAEQLAQNYEVPIGKDITAENKRGDLQQRAQALIDASLENSGVEPDYNKLVPLVMEALDTPGVKEDQIAASIRKPYNLDERGRGRAQEVQAGIEGAAEQVGPPAPKQPGTGGTAGKPADGLRAIYQAAVQRVLDAKTPEDRGIAQAEVDAAGKNYKQAVDLEQGQVTLKDGTIITSAMLHDPDPAVAAQYQQAYAAAQTDIENQNAKMLNQYGLDQYQLATGRVASANSAAIQQYNAEVASIRERLARDELSITQASEAVARAVNGLTESRARTQQELDTVAKFAPTGTVDGKTAFSGNDLGGAVSQVQRQGGGDPNSAVIKFPGVISLNPQTANARNDMALGVSGALPEIPGLSVSDADIPRAPQLASPGSIALPTLVAPKPVPVIRIPGQPGYDYAGAYGPRNTPYLTGSLPEPQR